MSAATDPGWRGAAKGLLFVVVPMMGARMAQRSDNALLLMRQAWVTFTAAAVLVWVPVLVLWTTGLVAGGDGRTWALIVVVVGVIQQLVAGVLVKPPVAKDPEEVRTLAQRGFFLRVALAESSAMLGFVGFVFTVNPAVYGAGFVVALAGLYDAAPTVAKLAGMQRHLDAEGCDVDVLAALAGGGLTR